MNLRTIIVLGCVIACVIEAASAARAGCDPPGWQTGPDQGHLGVSLTGAFGEGIRAMTIWDPDGAGDLPEQLIVGGGFIVAGGVRARDVATWDGSSWQAMGSGFNHFVHALTVYNGEVIAGGEFFLSGSQTPNRVARWSDGEWLPLDVGLNGRVKSLAVYQNELYAAGEFTTAGGAEAPRIARWDGAQWRNAGVTSAGANGTVTAMHVHGGALYASGLFTSIDGVSASRIAKWDGTAWSPLGQGLNGNANAMVTFGSELVAVGEFSTAGGTIARTVARWDGNQWFSMSAGILGGSAILKSALVHEGNLLVGGSFTSIDGVAANGIARWNGSGWESLGSGSSGIMESMVSWDGKVWVGGTINSVGGMQVDCIGTWDGSAWDSVGRGFSGSIKAFGEYADELIAGGDFRQAGHVRARGIAAWNGTSWRRLGGEQGVNGTVRALCQHQGKLIAAGTFTSIDGVSATNVAMWDGVAWAPMGGGLPALWIEDVYSDLNILLYAVGKNENGESLVAYWYNGHWTVIDVPNAGGLRRIVFYPLPFDQYMLLAGGEGGILESTNGGPWFKQPSVSGGVYDMCVFGNMVVACGDQSFSSQQIAQWSPSWGIWLSLGSLTHFLPVETVCVYNGQLIARGQVRLDAGGWTPMYSDSNLILPYYPATTSYVYKDQLVVAGDRFETTENVVMSRWGRWKMGGDPWVTSQPFASWQFCAGQSRTVTCNGDNVVSYQWRRNGVVLVNGVTQHGSVVSGATTKSLRITGTQPGDAGTYDCILSNGCGTVATNPAVFIYKLAADSNGDARVNGADLSIMLGQFGANVPVGTGADFNDDGLVNGADLSILLASFGQSC